jgi:hypothetical protein
MTVITLKTYYSKANHVTHITLHRVTVIFPYIHCVKVSNESLYFEQHANSLHSERFQKKKKKVDKF